MVFPIYKILLVLSSVSALLLAESKTASSSVEIQGQLLKKLTFRLDQIQSKNTENDVKIGYLEAKNVANEEKIGNLEKRNSKNENKIQLLEERNVEQDLEIKKLKTKIKDTKPIETKPQPFVDFSTETAEPSSCSELAVNGHSYNGFYLVKNPVTKKMETVSCKFGTSVIQKLIGNIDVKTKRVNFYVQRNSPFSTPNAVIPFELALLNVGEAMDLVSGVFTVPVRGIYHFEFTAVKDYSTKFLVVHFQVNGVQVGIANAQHTNTGIFDTISFGTSLRLNVGDKVNLFNWRAGVIFDDAQHHTHFSGWLMEEDLV